MAGRMEGKVALITGGASGIGRATAMAFAREGAKVAVADYMVDGGERTVKAIREAGGQAIFINADVSRSREVEAMVTKTVEGYGRLDCAFNNAGVEGRLANSAEASEEDWNRTIATNLTGVWFCMKFEIREMLKRSGGSIVNTASVAGMIGFPGFAPYCASKGGVIQLTRTAALDFAPHGVRVNAVNPGVVITNLHRRGGMDETKYTEFLERSKTTHPLGRPGRPEEIADLIAFLLSPAAGWITGETIAIDGGRHLTCLR